MPRYAFQLIISAEQKPGSKIVCVDVTALGGKASVCHYLETSGLTKRDRSETKVIAALGREGGDMSELAGLVDGITQRPETNAAEEWEKTLAPLITALLDPNYRDELPPEKTCGGVSQEEFAETLAQAALPSSDPNKRD